jgi:hypothetical protein
MEIKKGIQRSHLEFLGENWVVKLVKLRGKPATYHGL